MKLEKHLVLNKYFLSLFGFEEFDEFREKLKSHEEGFDNEGRSFFIDAIIGLSNLKISREDLLRYDRAIKEYVEKLIKNRRQSNFNLKYFQYLAVLFTEIFLERLYHYKETFIQEINQFIDEFNEKNKTEISHFSEEELKKLAFWMATGSGKTLIMHINYWQILKHSKDWDNIILITPNEGMSKQHFKEMRKSGISCKLYDGNIDNLKTRDGEVLIIDIHKLTEEKTGEGVTIDISYFDGKNLVFIDEGHKGQKSEEQKWKQLREQIGRNGFIFEYSATFGQVIGKNKDLLEEYAKAILFDYSYKYFYTDGYGKDFYVYNLKEDLYSEKYTDLIITANLLSYYEQLMIYEQNKTELKEYGIEKPLWIFVGSKVSGKGLDSDVIKIIKFLKKIIENKEFLKENITKILKGESKLIDEEGNDIFKDKFRYLKEKKVNLDEIYAKVFCGQGVLKLYEIKNADGEIGLRVGEKYFGVVNVGNISSVKKLLKEIDIEINEDNFTNSLFFDINEEKSSINILIGSKKFVEGWDSWRVSSMCLLNMGKGEGPQIIQLFGRGIRLKGKEFSLKRGETPDYFLKNLQTLFIFGFNADYINAFLEMIKREEVEYEELTIPIKLNREKEWNNRIYTIKTKDFDFTNNLLELLVDDCILRSMKIDIRPKIAIAHGLRTGTAETMSEEPTFEFLKYADHIDWDEVYTEITNYRLSKGYYNLLFTKEILIEIIKSKKYRFFATIEQMQLNNFSDVEKIKNIILALLKTYIDKMYRHVEKQEMMNNLVVEPLTKNNENINFGNITLKIPKNMISEFKSFLQDLKKIYEEDVDLVPTVHFDRHLYTPLIIYKKGGENIKSSPVKLNKGETQFVLDLRNYLIKSRENIKKKEIFLLRNLSRRGIGFFKITGFYPDFILWIKDKEKQKIIFIDPKGIRNLGNFNDNKIQFCTDYIKEIEKIIKKEVDEKTVKEKLELFAFIVSVSKYDEIKDNFGTGQHTKEEFEEHNIIFIEDINYINKMLNK